MLKKFAKSSSFEYLVTTRRMLYLSNILFLVKRIPCKSLTSTKFRTGSERSRHDCGVSSPAQSVCIYMDKASGLGVWQHAAKTFPRMQHSKDLGWNNFAKYTSDFTRSTQWCCASCGTCSVNIISYYDLTGLLTRTTILCQTTHTTSDK